MDNRSLSRELTLISLGLIKDKYNDDFIDFQKQFKFERTFEAAIEIMTNHCRSMLDESEVLLEKASQNLIESELNEIDSSYFEKIRIEIKKSFSNLELVMNILSDTLEFPKMIALSDQKKVKEDIKDRISKIINNLFQIDNEINNVMEGWRFKRLPRVDRDILRLAYIDINFLNTPISVACNEAVNLANKYSDPQGRKMINGVLRKMQKS